MTYCAWDHGTKNYTTSWDSSSCNLTGVFTLNSCDSDSSPKLIPHEPLGTMVTKHTYRALDYCCKKFHTLWWSLPSILFPLVSPWCLVIRKFYLCCSGQHHSDSVMILQSPFWPLWHFWTPGCDCLLKYQINDLSIKYLPVSFCDVKIAACTVFASKNMHVQTWSQLWLCICFWLHLCKDMVKFFSLYHLPWIYSYWDTSAT
jgi:hypothetical protein